MLHTLGGGQRAVGELVAAAERRQAKLSQHPILLHQRGIETTRRADTTAHDVLAYPATLETSALVRER